jgi:Ku protein
MELASLSQTAGGPPVFRGSAVSGNKITRLSLRERIPGEFKMASRAYWKGYLKLSLVTCPVALFPASSKAQKTRFHQINKKTGHRLRQQMVDEATGRAVDSENKGRGYELTKGKFVEIEPEEIEAIEFENTHTIEIDKFVPEAEIDKRYYERPYYIVPDGKSGEEAFTVIRDAMKDKGRVALAGIIFANRQHILAIEPWGKGMLGTTLRYDYEVRDEDEFFKGIGSHRVPKEMVSLASHILDSKAGSFDPAKFKDEYELALRKLVKRKAAGKTIEAPDETEDRSNVVDLMEALRQSVKGRAAALRASSSSKKSSRPRARSKRRKKAA